MYVRCAVFIVLDTFVARLAAATQAAAAVVRVAVAVEYSRKRGGVLRMRGASSQRVGRIPIVSAVISPRQEGVVLGVYRVVALPGSNTDKHID